MTSQHKLSASVLCPILFSFLFAACTSDNLPKYSLLGGLRVLALVVDQPQVQNPAAGTLTVNLTPYISDINDTGSVTLQVQSCLDPGVEYGALPICTGALYASSVQTITVTAPSGQAAGVFGTPERTGAPSTGSIAVGLQIPSGLLSTFSSPIQTNGVSYLITVVASNGSSTVNAFRRVVFSNQTPTTNPVLSDLLANGASLTSLPGTDVDLSFAASTTPATYQFMDNYGNLSTISEVYQTTWFVSDGEIDNPRTLATESTLWNVPSAEPSSRKIVVVGVLRDGHEGESVIVRTF